MKKTITYTLLIILILIFGLVTILTFKGYETNKFNNFIEEKILERNPQVNLKLDKILMKLDIKKFNLLLFSEKPELKYQEIAIPILKFKIYINLISLLKTQPKIEEVFIDLNESKIENLKKLVVRMKPSNYKRFILNNIGSGTLKSEINLTFGKNLSIKKFKINGETKDLNIKVKKNIEFEKAKFIFNLSDENFSANLISGKFRGIKLKNGKLNIDKKNEIKIDGSFDTNIDFKDNQLQAFLEGVYKTDYLNKKIRLLGNSKNKFNVRLSESLEILDYNVNFNADLKDSVFSFNNEINIAILQSRIKNIYFDKSKIKLNLNKSNNNLSINGVYKFIKSSEFTKYRIDSNFKKSITDLVLNFDFKDIILIDFINYKKSKNKVANLKTKIKFNKKSINIENLEYIQEKNLILFNSVELDKKYRLKKFKNIKVLTNTDGVENNNFEVIYGKKLNIKGEKFDSTNLLKQFSNKKKNNFLNNINKEIKIDLKKIFTKLSISIGNFILLGKIENGKLVKISSKSEFSKDKFLDISLKTDAKSKKKIIEIFSDSPKPILADYKVFNSIQGGKLLFTSTFDDEVSKSNLIIEDFKIINAPGFAKLLTLADFGGVADLLSGEGISFHTLDIKFESNQEKTEIKELYSVGPSISILMDGYIEKKSSLVSFRGTMIPAKELNKLISKIPILGNILIGKELGEGIFGVSFKIKGLPGKTKTTVNPIKTLTPRFITRALEKRKKK